MAQSWKKAKRSQSHTPGQESKCLDREGHPELAAWLGGVPTPDYSGWELHAHTLTLWVQGDMLHWCLQSKDEVNKIFGSVVSMDHISDRLEQALEKEEFSPRKREK